MLPDEIRVVSELKEHLAGWGLRRFEHDDAYFQWQRESLSSTDLFNLHRHIEEKRRGGAAEEAAFYDATAAPHLLPVLYSQRYDYYMAVGPRVAARITPARSILDVGCGVGILTTFYARLDPDCRLVGIDRSASSVARARERAGALGLRNVEFHALDCEQANLPELYDLIVATHAVVQAEHDPGIPSESWRTFERRRDEEAQQAFEQRTGLGPKLDRLVSLLNADGRMVVFEKTRPLARRLPFQRALQRRGLSLCEPPEPVRYQLVEEVAEDGPFYVLAKGRSDVPWDESPEDVSVVRLDFDRLSAKGNGEPLFEDHSSSAQEAWLQLPDRRIVKETTRQGPDGRQLHVEVGKSGALFYLYVANTFDQRQLVIMDMDQRQALESYYSEIVGKG